MNGVTGEVQGERPWSRIKLALFIGAIVVVVAVIAIIVGMLN